jgi:hypothetical protein
MRAVIVCSAAALLGAALWGCAPASSTSGSSVPATAAVPATVSAAATASVPQTAAPRPQVLDSLPAPRPGAMPTQREIFAAIRQFLVKNSTGLKLAAVDSVKYHRDARGRWWVSAYVIPAGANTNQAIIYFYKDGSRWKLFDLGSGIDPSELPAEVRGWL